MSHSTRVQVDAVTLLHDYFCRLFDTCAGEALVTFEVKVEQDRVDVTMYGPDRARTNAVSEILHAMCDSYVRSKALAENAVILPDTITFSHAELQALVSYLQQNEATFQQLVASLYISRVKKFEVLLWFNESLKLLKSSLQNNPDLAPGYAILKKSVREKFSIDIDTMSLAEVRETVRKIYNNLPHEVTQAIASGHAVQEVETKRAQADKQKIQWRKAYFNLFENTTTTVPDEKSQTLAFESSYLLASHEFDEKERDFTTTLSKMKPADHLARCQKLVELAKAAERYAPNEETDLWLQRIEKYETLISYHKAIKPKC
jgi:hypothetical protein